MVNLIELLCQQNNNYHNSDDSKRHICNLDELYKNPQLVTKVKISKGLGNGHIRRVFFENFFEIIEFNMELDQKIQLPFIKKKSSIEIFICNEGTIMLDNCMSSVHFLRKGDTSISFNHECDKAICCGKGDKIKAIKIQIFDNYICTFKNHITNNKNNKTFLIKTKNLTPQLSLIYMQIVNSLHKKNIDRIYVKGKVLELAALYLNQLIPPKSKINDMLLSKTDVKSLYSAKKILDDNIVNPPCLKELSKMVYLNEFKLKNGFKLIFGKPIYTYVKEQKLDLARFIFEDKKLLVSEVTDFIGYKNVSHFTNAFRKKYGVTAGDYRKSILQRNL